MDKLTWMEMEARASGPDLLPSLRNARRLPGTDGVALLECRVLDSSWIGRQTFLAYGPGRTFKSLDEMTSRSGGVYVTGMPSTASFVIAYTTECPREEQ